MWWIESEEWLEHSWDIYDTNTDVIVTFQKGDIEEVISDLIHENNFESVFRKCENYDV
jgi:hypothetical protein